MLLLYLKTLVVITFSSFNKTYLSIIHIWHILLVLIYEVCDLCTRHMMSVVEDINHKVFINTISFTTINEIWILLDKAVVFLLLWLSS